MKRILISTLIVAICITGCAPVVQESPAIQKDMEQMINTASRQVADEPRKTQNLDLYGRLGAPKQYIADDLKTPKGKLTVHINANIVLPECELPIVRVKRRLFTADEAKTFAEALFPSGIKFVDPQADLQTKGWYKRQIEHLRKAMDEFDSTGHFGWYDVNFDNKAEAEKGLEEMIRKAESAPQTLIAVTPDYSWKKPEVYTSEGRVDTSDHHINLVATSNDIEWNLMSVSNSTDLFPANVQMYYQTEPTIEVMVKESVDISRSVKITKEAAQKLALDTLAKMRVDGFVCSGSSAYGHSYDDSVGAYGFFFTRQINGITETCYNDENTDIYDGMSWQYEKIRIFVNDDGVVYADYSGPTEVTEIVAEKTTLMPFEQIREVFEKMVIVVGSRIDNITYVHVQAEYVVTEVRLGLTCMPEQGKDTALLVPTWSFMGYEKGRSGSGADYSVGSNGYDCILAINAIDGSVVHTSKA